MVAATKEEILKFSMEVERIAIKKELTLIEAILEYCDEVGIEPETATKLISIPLKYKIADQAAELNLIKKPKTRRLPI